MLTRLLKKSNCNRRGRDTSMQRGCLYAFSMYTFVYIHVRTQFKKSSCLLVHKNDDVTNITQLYMDAKRLPPGVRSCVHASRKWMNLDKGHILEPRRSCQGKFGARNLSDSSTYVSLGRRDKQTMPPRPL